MDQSTLDFLAQKHQLGKAEFFSSLPSTNTLAASWAADGCPDISMIIADQQTSGKGRSGRQWHTIPGSSIAMSLILQKLEHPMTPSSIIALPALAAADALEEFSIHPVSIKWPNDILISGKKVAGILVESQWEQDAIKNIIIGIGINVTAESLHFPTPPRVPATYLEAHTSSQLSRAEILDTFIRRFLYWRNILKPSKLISAWNERLAYKDQEIEAIRNGSERISGKLIGVSDSGELMIRLRNKTITYYEANEIREISSLPRRSSSDK